MITSKQNPLVKEIRALNRRKEREESGTFVAEGAKFVSEALRGPFPVRRVLVAPKGLKSQEGQDILEKARKQGAEIVEVSDEVMDYVSGTESPQGVLAQLEMAGQAMAAHEASALGTTGQEKSGQRALEEICGRPDALVVVVDGVQDPGNLGTIIRSAHAAGASGVVLLENTVDLFNPKTLRATMGSVFHVPVVQGADAGEVAEVCGKYGAKLLVAEGMSHGGTPYTKSDLTAPFAFVVGSEGHGPSEECRSISGGTISIPLPGGAESLNVAVAAALILFEAVRQRNKQ